MRNAQEPDNIGYKHSPHMRALIKANFETADGVENGVVVSLRRGDFPYYADLVIAIEKPETTARYLPPSRG